VVESVVVREPRATDCLVLRIIHAIQLAPSCVPRGGESEEEESGGGSANKRTDEVRASDEQ
jgi:hypothetical protein